MKDDGHIFLANLSFKFLLDNNSYLSVIEDLSFNVRRGEFLCIIGPSGCGKTTLLKLICGILKIEKGNIKILWNDKENKQRITLVFQDLNLFYWMTALKNVEVVLRARNINNKESVRLAQSYLNRVKLNNYEKYYPHELSGGQRQRLAIARALATEAEIILLDEPFSNLDEKTKLNIEEDFLDLWEKQKLTVIMVTQSIQEALKMADRIVVFSERPAKIKKEFRIDLPRPRLRGIEYAEEFKKLEGEIWSIINE